MSRLAARIKHDEITRMVKAVRACGLPIQRVTFDGNRLDVIIGDIEQNSDDSIDDRRQSHSVAEVETL